MIIFFIIPLLIAVFAVVLLLIWNLALNKKVKAKTGKLSNMHVKLKESEERIRILLVNLNVGIAVFAAEGNLLECNQRFLELGTGLNLQANGQPLIEQSRLNQTLIKPPSILPVEEIIKYFIDEQGARITKDEFPVNKVI